MLFRAVSIIPVLLLTAGVYLLTAIVRGGERLVLFGGILHIPVAVGLLLSTIALFGAMAVSIELILARTGSNR